MLTGFEDITKELTNEEKLFLKPLLNGFNSHGKDNPIKAPDIVEAMNKWAIKKGIKANFSEVRLRKMVNAIRTNGVLPLIATDKGYYTTTERAELEKQILSLRERANSIMRCATGLQKIMDNL